MPTSVKKRSVVVHGHRTSVSLEAAFWDALRELAVARGRTVNQLVAEIDAGRGGNLSSAIRVHVLNAAREGQFGPAAPAPAGTSAAAGP